MNKTTLAAAIIIALAVTSFAIYQLHIQGLHETQTGSSVGNTPSMTPQPAGSPSTSGSHGNESQSQTGGQGVQGPTSAPYLPSIHLPTPEGMETFRTITIVDNAGRNITLTVPVQRIVSLNDGLTEMLCALGAESRMVGRDATSTMPPSILKVPVVGENSYQPNVEVILELKPDIIFADSMLAYNTEAMKQLEKAGIPIFISDPTDPKPTPRSNTTVVDFTCDLLWKMAIIVGGERRAEEYIQFAQYYNNLVKQRIANLPDNKRPKVMWEWYMPYYTFISPAIYHAGGINIAENMTVYAPVMSPEFVVEQNPQVIIRMISSPAHDLNEFKEMWEEIMSRPELQNTDAIKMGRVYICDWKLRNGICSVVGYLYFAKWVHPELFEDIDPAQVMAELYMRFFGISIEGTFAYP